VGIGLIRYAEQPLPRILGAIYPLAVVPRIVVTGNHFFFDALAGAAVLGAGFSWQSAQAGPSKADRGVACDADIGAMPALAASPSGILDPRRGVEQSGSSPGS
jgi:PAP2 superfamily